MIYIIIAAVDFVLFSVVVYATTYKKYIGKNSNEKGRNTLEECLL
jgi:hypothetical protein